MPPRRVVVAATAAAAAAAVAATAVLPALTAGRAPPGTTLAIRWAPSAEPVAVAPAGELFPSRASALTLPLPPLRRLAAAVPAAAAAAGVPGAAPPSLPDDVLVVATQGSAVATTTVRGCELDGEGDVTLRVRVLATPDRPQRLLGISASAGGCTVARGPPAAAVVAPAVAAASAAAPGDRPPGAPPLAHPPLTAAAG
ncbi:hypothetical protein I4F81_011306 [Pyropia yezoensis]|uniref:Uncharacterized protein n=1 Tax=Pyropia yezoensis TaxID=2788 RepID=A0ACC3CFF8_PYRYE|nr:hypothetical protein I4F81_011306 [Neopyropia yezoensis]